VADIAELVETQAEMQVVAQSVGFGAGAGEMGAQLCQTAPDLVSDLLPEESG
jgi:hypothetical protein